MKTGEIVREYYRQQGEHRERTRIRDRINRILCRDAFILGECEHVSCYQWQMFLKVVDNQ